VIYTALAPRPAPVRALPSPSVGRCFPSAWPREEEIAVRSFIYSSAPLALVLWLVLLTPAPSVRAAIPMRMPGFTSARVQFAPPVMPVAPTLGVPAGFRTMPSFPMPLGSPFFTNPAVGLTPNLAFNLNGGRGIGPILNPYAMTAAGFGNRSNPDASGTGYSGLPSGYGGTSQPSGGYGGGYPASNHYADPFQSYTSGAAGYAPPTSSLNPQQTSAAMDIGTLLTALGVPNDRGRVSWPVGLQVLSPATENQELLQQFEALLQVAAGQAASGPVSPHTVEAATRSLNRLRVMLRDKKGSMFAANYKEAERFLDKLQDNLKALP
jgi:hypothetical protein